MQAGSCIAWEVGGHASSLKELCGFAWISGQAVTVEIEKTCIIAAIDHALLTGFAIKLSSQLQFFSEPCPLAYMAPAWMQPSASLPSQALWKSSMALA